MVTLEEGTYTLFSGDTFGFFGRLCSAQKELDTLTANLKWT